MKIVGKTRDFYDKVLTHGFDEDLVFVRKNEIIEVPHIGLYKRDTHPELRQFESIRHQHAESGFNFLSRRNSSTFGIVSRYYNSTSNEFFQISKLVVLFCGKVYRCIRFEFNEKNELGIDETKNTYLYTEHAIHQMVVKYDHIIKEYDKRHKTNFSEKVVPHIIKYIENNGRYSEEVAKYLYEKKIAYMAIFGSPLNNVDFVVEYHPLLKDLHFMQAMDPFTVFQEISMFIGNIPRDPNMMVTLTDKEELVKKGFDNWSFKKYPTKKRT